MDMLGKIIGSALHDGEKVELLRHREPSHDKTVLTVGEPRVESVRFSRDGEVVFEATPREIMTAFLDVMILRYPKTYRPRQTDTNAANNHGGSER